MLIAISAASLAVCRSAISCRRPTRWCLPFRWRSRSSGRRIRRSPIRWRCRASGASARTIPRMRIWGSIAFLRGNFVGGIILAATSADAVPVMITVGLGATLAAALVRAAPWPAAPRLAAFGGRACRMRRRSCSTAISCCSSPASASSMPATASSYGFVSIYWKSIGISDTVVGLLWAWAVVAEVGMFMVFTAVFGSISATAVLGIAGVARDRALGRLSADLAARARRCRASSPSRAARAFDRRCC